MGFLRGLGHLRDRVEDHSATGASGKLQLSNLLLCMWPGIDWGLPKLEQIKVGELQTQLYLPDGMGHFLL